MHNSKDVIDRFASIALVLCLIVAIATVIFAVIGPIIGNIYSNIVSDNFCGWFGTARTWLDANGNGEFDADEPPLPHVPLSVQVQGESGQSGSGQSKSNLKGYVLLEVHFPGECRSRSIEVTITAQPFPDYRLTTPRIRSLSTRSEGIFGYHDYERNRPIALFGFTYLPGAPTVTPRPPAPACSAMAEMKGYEITDIVIAPNHSAWFAADRAASIFQFDPKNNELKSFAVGSRFGNARSIAVSADNTVWVNTDYGIFRLDGSSWRLYTTTHGLLNDQAQAIAATPDGNVWFWSADGLSALDVRTTTWTYYTAPEELRSGDFIFPDRDGSVWLIPWPDDIVYHLIPHGGENDMPAWNRHELPHSPYYRSVELAVLPEDTVWAIDWMSIYQLDLDTTEWLTYEASGLVSSGFSTLAVSADGSLWLGTQEDGIVHFNPAEGGSQGDQWRGYDTDDGLTDNRITKVVIAPDGILWVGTRNGVARCEIASK